MRQVIFPGLLEVVHDGAWVPVKASAAAFAGVHGTAPVVCLYGAAGLGKSHLLTLAREQGAYTVDDLEQLTPDSSAELFHALQAALQRAGPRVVVASRAPAAQLTGLLADVRSRLLLAPQLEVGRPDDDELRALFSKWSVQRQLVLTQAVADYVLARADRNPAALYGFLRALDGVSLTEKRAITVPLVRQLLEQTAQP